MKCTGVTAEAQLDLMVQKATADSTVPRHQNTNTLNNAAVVIVTPLRWKSEEDLIAA